jgi:hypothetical protein
LSVNGLDVVGDVNQRTHGTEFYGTSSNFVLLNQLFAFARKHHPSGYVSYKGHKATSYLFPASVGDHDEIPTPSGNSLSTSDEHDDRPGLTALSQNRVSIISLLSNEGVLSPPSNPKTPQHVTSDQRITPDDSVVISSRASERLPDSTVRENPMVVPQSTQNEYTANLATHSYTSTGPDNRVTTAPPTQASKSRLEQVYIHVFLDNLHHLHPMLDPVLFEERCERDVWGTHTTVERCKGSRYFFALYNIVVAVGALVAGSNVIKNLGRDVQLCTVQLTQPENPELAVSSQTVSRVYFRKSKDLLGDASEVCSLESAQTLLLMVTTRHHALDDI